MGLFDNGFKNCSISSIEELATKIKFYQSVKSLFTTMHSLGVLGSQDNRYQYWDKNVEKPCAIQSCPRIDEIKREVISFSANSNKCSC